MNEFTYKDAIDYIESIKPFGSKPGLERISELMKRLGNVQDSLQYIHVAGTNGKGSFATYMSSILVAAGFKTGLYISPSLVKINERFQINNEQISDEDFARLTSIVKEKADDMERDGLERPTEYETTNAIAFLYFAEQECDFVVLETGMGGRLDSTNIIKDPLLSVIMTISYDHMKYLGNTLPEIATEKAGIIKKDSAVLFYPNRDRLVKDVFVAKAKSLGTACYEGILPQTLSHDLNGQTFSMARLFPNMKNSSDAKQFEFHTKLLGQYEINNAAMAIEASLILNSEMKRKGLYAENAASNPVGVAKQDVSGAVKSTASGVAKQELKNVLSSISFDAIHRGIEEAEWPCRFELLKKHPYFIIDAAHNVEGVKALTESLKAYFPYLCRHGITFITGVLKDKEYEKMFTEIMPYAKKFYTVTPDSNRAMPSEELASYLNSRSGVKAFPCTSYEEAADKALSGGGYDDVIVAFGSLYFAGKLKNA